MDRPSIEFHKLWIEQCEADDIRRRYGQKSALDYLIGEKLFSFVAASEEKPEFAAELAAFVAEIRQVFAPADIREYLDNLEHSKILAPPDPYLEADEDEEVGEDPWPDNPILGAEELLQFSRIRELLLQ